MSSHDRRVDAARALVAVVANQLQADLSVRLWTGEVLPLGPGAQTDLQLVIGRPGAIRQLLLKPGLATVFGLFARGDLRIEGGSALEAADRCDVPRLVHLARRIDRSQVVRLALPFLLTVDDGPQTDIPQWATPDGIGQDRRQRRDADYIAFHYDVGNDFYRLFLDPQMVYSGAVFDAPDTPLDVAQSRKLDLICRKLDLKPGQRLLDIGCGWGGLALHAARHYGVQVHGVTLSQAQLDFARGRVAEASLADQITLEKRDYRELAGERIYDAISQVEMFEHVGFANHAAHFQTVHRLLKPGGLYFHQASVRRGYPSMKPTATTRTINRFIFPGGELDSIGMTVANLGDHGFEVLDVQNLRDDFALTLRHWCQRLHAHHDQAVAEVGEARARMWALYFALFAKGFERGAVLLYQTVARRRSAGPNRWSRPA